jgi:Putative addiction module component
VPADVRIRTMSEDASRVLEEALRLLPTERARIAGELLASLDDKEEDVASAWAAEIARRAADAMADPDDDEDWREALIEIRQDVLAR